MMPRLIAFFVFLCFAEFVHAQKEASVWYFGLRAGLDFNSGSPTPLLDGNMNTMEGVTSIADANGNILFYSNGQEVWNRQHNIMPNGTGLNGHFSSSQSAIVVPKINDAQRYYLFTVDAAGGPNGFCYSIINLSLDNGNGDVEVKNINLESFVCEKLTAVKHCNGQDIWVLVHRFNSADILAYLITAAGVNPVPVVSSAGLFVPASNTSFSVGCMKVSPDGSKLAIAHHELGAEVLDFNNQTGIASGGGPLFLSPMSIDNPKGAYGVEFSPDSKLLYVSGDYRTGTPSDFANYLLQYDVTKQDIDFIRASKYLVAWKPRISNAYPNYGTLQIGIDGRIYLSETHSYYLSVIDFPNSRGATCGFNYRSLYLGRLSTFGLPTFIQSNFRGSFSYRGNCSGETIHFDYEKSPNELAIKWDFGDAGSGSNNYSTRDSSSHIFSTSGNYIVKLIRFTACNSDTVSKTVVIGESPVSLGTDTTLCGASQFIINPQTTGSNNSFLWQDGSSSSTYAATQTGLFWLELTNNSNGCKSRDSIKVVLKPDPIFSLGSDLDKCEGDVVSLFVNPSPGNSSYLWGNGSTSNSIQVTQTGDYWLELTMDGCKKSDTVTINFHTYPIVNIGPDTTLCEGDVLRLDAKNVGMQYLWENSATNQFHDVTTTGIYWVRVGNYGCVSRDTVNVRFLDKPLFELMDTTLCQGMTMTLAPTIKKGDNLSLLWNTGSTDTGIVISQQGTFLLTISNQCADVTRSITVGDGRCQLYMPSAFTPNGDGKNDVFKALDGKNVIEFNLQVYNRWGELVFSSKDINKGWDGRYKNKLQDSGVYVWIVNYRTITDIKENTLKGKVLLIR